MMGGFGGATPQLLVALSAIFSRREFAKELKLLKNRKLRQFYIKIK